MQLVFGAAQSELKREQVVKFPFILNEGVKDVGVLRDIEVIDVIHMKIKLHVQFLCRGSHFERVLRR